MTTPRKWHEEAQRILARQNDKHPAEAVKLDPSVWSYDDLDREDGDHEDPMYAEDLYHRVWGHGPDVVEYDGIDEAYGPGEDYEGREAR